METNHYCEQLVRVKQAKWQTALLRILQVMTVAYFATGLLNNVLFLFGFLLLLLTWFWKRKITLEYDYQYLDGVLQVDKIINLKKRKTCGQYDMDKLCLMAPEGDEGLDAYLNQSGVKTVDYSSRDEASQKRYVAVYRAKETLCLILEPSEQMVQTMWRAAPGKVVRKRKEC